jgi:hypothetical protein
MHYYTSALVEMSGQFHPPEALPLASLQFLLHYTKLFTALAKSILLRIKQSITFFKVKLQVINN